VRRVLWLTKGLGRGGAERLLVDAARLVDPENFELEIVYLLPWKSDLVGEAEASGATVRCITNAPRAIDWPLRLIRMLRKERFDVIHTHAPLPAVVARLFGQADRFVHTEHNVWPRYRRLTRWLNAVTYRKNDHVIAVSSAVADSIDAGRVRDEAVVEVVFHGIVHDRVSRGETAAAAARASLQLAEEAFVVGTVGNMTAQKDHATLLTAFRTFAAAHHEARLVIIGSGPLEDATQRLADELGIADSVCFLGKRDDVPALIPAFDVFTLSSQYEGLPIALLEAMASEVAPVATAVGGIPEVIVDGVSGLLVPAGEPRALVTAWQRLAEETELRAKMADEARRASSYFDLSTAVKAAERSYGAESR